MDNNVIFSLYDTILSLIFGLVTIYISLRVIDKLVLRESTLKMVKEGNTSIAIFKGVLIICTLLLTYNSIESSGAALRTMVFNYGGNLTGKIFLISLGYFLLFYAISLVFSVLVILISFYVYIKATVDLDEIAEIKKNNIAVSISLSLVIFGMTLFIRPSLDKLTQSFINYDAFSDKQINVDNKDKKGGITPSKNPNIR
ncbi:MAG TPA: hypothetical protein DCS93_02580 [Microscillaceae bacterium]|nr:hypothetical protein [Microscillaceae bacterium]